MSLFTITFLGAIRMDKYLLESMHSGCYSEGIWKIFEAYKKDCVNFIETGTHFGNSVAMALLLNFKKAYSCELNSQRYDHCVKRFKNYPVELYNGMSTDGLKEMLPKVKGKSFFWLDAHAEGGGVPTLEELDIIKEYSQNSTIAIDDIPAYFGNGNSLREELLKINPKYIIKMLPTIAEDYVMIAYKNE